MNATHQNQRNFPGREKLEEIVLPILRAHGAEIVDLELVGTHGARTLRVFVEREGSSDSATSTDQASVDLGVCATVARELSPALDVADVIPGRYTLEVSTPGVERALHDKKDFLRFQSKKAKFKLSPAVSGQNVLVGTIADVHSASGKEGPGEAFTVVVEDGARKYDISSSSIVHANLVFEFGLSTRPNARGKAPHQKRQKSNRK